MHLKVNTFILKGFDHDQTQFLNTSIEYLSTIRRIENKITIVENLNLNLAQDDFLILLIDELFLEQIIHNKYSKEFFLKKQYQNNQIILILDDIDIQKLPDSLQLFQSFTLINDQNLIGEDFDKSVETKVSQSNLFEIVNDLVHHISRIKTGDQKKNLTVYIGPADDNTTLVYQKITRELLHRDYNLVPEIANPSANEIINNQIYFTDVLKSADLSIHFIGHKSLLNHPERNSVALKVNEIAANFCATPAGKTLQRIIYIPNDRFEANELLSKKILHFKSNTKSLLNAELVQTPIEKFKEVVLLKLNDLSKPTAQLDEVVDVVDDLYIIYPPGEEQGVKPYMDWLDKNKLKCSRSQIELDQLELLNYHQKKLVSCKAVAIYNNGNKEWLNRKLSDIKKSPGWGRKKAFKLKVIFGLEPDIFQKTNDDSFTIIGEKNRLESNDIITLLKD